jgi:hypothetical protein
MYAIVFAMVIKPTSDDGWVIAIGVAVLIALSVFFLAPLRSSSAQQPPSPATD